MNLLKIIAALLLSAAASVSLAQSKPAMDDSNYVTTVMQFTARSSASVDELKKRMLAVGAFIRENSKVVNNVLMKNTNAEGTPHFVGVAQWKSIKDWEALWLSTEFQKLVTELSKVGTLEPGIYAPVSR